MGFFSKRYRGKARKWQIRTLIKKHKGLCQNCGCFVNFIHGDFKQATVDHIKPVSKGGTDTLDNITLLCSKCNNLKGNSYDSFTRFKN